MTDTADPSPVRRAPRWMWIALILSLAANLIVVGMATAAIMHWRSHIGGPAAGFERFAMTLPSARRDELRRILAAQRAAVRPLRQRSRDARRRARQAFMAEPFDLATLKQAYAEAHAAQMELGTRRGDTFMALAEKLTAEERRAYIEWRRQNRRQRWRRPRGDG